MSKLPSQISMLEPGSRCSSEIASTLSTTLQSGLPLNRLEHLISIGIELSSQRNLDELLNRILEAAQLLTNADGGTIYLIHQKQLEFAIIRNKTLGIHLGGRGGMHWRITRFRCIWRMVVRIYRLFRRLLRYSAKQSILPMLTVRPSSIFLARVASMP
jgi:hypothetical protein